MKSLRRKGAIELQWRFMAMLLFNAIILVIIVGFSWRLMGLLSEDDTASRAYRNFEILTDRLDIVYDNYDGWDQSLSVIIDVPAPYVLAVMKKGHTNTAVSSRGTDSDRDRFAKFVTASKKCEDRACICLGVRHEDTKNTDGDKIANYEVIQCKEYPKGVEVVYRSWNEEINDGTIANRGIDEPFFIPAGPRSLKLYHKDFKNAAAYDRMLVIQNPTIIDCSGYANSDDGLERKAYLNCHGKVLIRDNIPFYGFSTSKDADGNIGGKCYRCSMNIVGRDFCGYEDNVDISLCENAGIPVSELLGEEVIDDTDPEEGGSR